jgi:transposase
MTDKANFKKPSKQNRHFSEEFKRQKVKEIDENLLTITEIAKEYEISRTSVYNWVYKYSKRFEQGVNQVVQLESEQEKTKKLKLRLAELERIVGQKQMKIDYLEKMIEIGSDELGVDIKKKFNTPPLTGSEPTKENTNIE